jgi:hypothetical protein
LSTTPRARWRACGALIRRVHYLPVLRCTHSVHPFGAAVRYSCSVLRCIRFFGASEPCSGASRSAFQVSRGAAGFVGSRGFVKNWACNSSRATESATPPPAQADRKYRRALRALQWQKSPWCRGAAGFVGRACGASTRGVVREPVRVGRCPVPLQVGHRPG